jgi:hypothetical protein
LIRAADVRRVALTLPEAVDESTQERLVFSVARKGFAWTFLERPAPKQKRRPRLDILAVCCTRERKEFLIEAAPDIYFDDDHYRGFPAVLVRLERIAKKEFAALLEDAWRLKAPKRLVKTHARHATAASRRPRRD